MDSKEPVLVVQQALKLLDEVDEEKKSEGIEMLRVALKRDKPKLVDLGYDKVIFKEFIKISQFEAGHLLESALELLKAHYFEKLEHLDELAETLIYRVARSSDQSICRPCLEKISDLIDYSDDSIAKHSKQLLKLADLNDNTELNPIISNILEKIKTKLPTRKKINALGFND